MKKRALSWLLALTMLLTLAPQTLPVWASATGEKSSTATQTESKLSANTYSALGLSRNVADSEKPKDQPYGKAEVGNTIATNVINELYVNFNGSIHYGWSILDSLTMQYKTNISDWTSSGNFYGAMGYWRPNQQPVHYGTGNEKEGALFAKNETNTGGAHNALGSSINSANKHLTYQYSKSEAFSPNTGKDNYVAEMTIDSASQVYLYIYQVEGGNKRYVRSKFVCNASASGGDANDKTNIIYNWEYDAMYDIAAGDMDGDGYDEIAVYAQNYVYVYSFEDGTLSELIKKETVKPEGVNEGGGKYKKLKTAVVTLAFGDLNADDKDELVIAENIGYGSSKIADGKVGIYSLTSAKKLHEEKIISLKYDDSMMVRYANVATGDIDKDYKDELIIAGYISADVFGQTIVGKDNIAYRVVDGTDTGYTVGDWKTTSFVKKELLGRVVDNANQLIPPVALTCAATQGVGHAEQIFLAGCLYSYNTDGSLTKLTEISTNREYKKDNGNKANKEEIFVVNVVAGNFNGNRNGQEQIVYAFGMKHDDSDRYWYDIGYINKKEPGDTNANSSSGYWYGQEQVMNYESSYNRDSSKARASLYLSLAAVDCDDDSTLMRYKGKTVTWTKPEVLTVLQSAPYFQDLEDTRGYLDQGQTGLGKSKAAGDKVTAGGSLSLGTYVSFEQDFSVFGVKVASIEAEAQSKNSFTYAYEETKKKETEINYSGSAGDDYAVVYAVPYMEYQYETWVPGYTVTTEYLKTYLADKLGKAVGNVTEDDINKAMTEFGIKVGTKVEGSWQPSSVMVPMEPAKVLITVDDYDEIAEQTEGLEPIRGNILNSTPGDPSTYDNGENPRDGFTPIGEWQTVTKGAGGNITVTETSTTEKSHDFEYSYEFEAKVGAGAGGLTVGVLAGYGTNVGGGTSSSSSKSYSATVDNLPKDADGYGFSWRFGYRKAKLNNNDVLVLEYEQKGTYAKPSPPKNLRVESVTSDSVTLSWDPVTGAGAYNIYQVGSDGETFPMKTLAGTATSWTNTGLSNNRSYTYVAETITQAGQKSLTSASVNTCTLEGNKENFKILTQPEVGETEAAAGDNISLTVTAEYKNANGTLNDLHYRWQTYNTTTRKWENIDGATSQTYTVKVTDQNDGKRYRCQVYSSASLYLYSKEVTLKVGRSTTETTLQVPTDTVYSAYTKTSKVPATDAQGKPQLVQVQETDATDKERYKYQYKTEGTPITVYIKTETTTATDGTKTTTTTYYNDSGTPVTPTKKYTLSYQKPQTGETEAQEIRTEISAPTEDTLPTEPVKYSKKNEAGADEEYVASKAFKIKIDATDAMLYFHQGSNDEDSLPDLWFVKIGENTYTADLEEYETLKIGETEIDITALEPVMVDTSEQIMTEVQEPQDGQEVTLTANVGKENEGGQKIDGSVTFKIVNTTGYGGVTETVQVGTHGKATMNWKPTTAGVYVVTAIYSGSEMFKESQSQSYTINVVTPGEQKLVLSGENMTYGESKTLKATLFEGGSASGTTNVSTTDVSNNVTYTVMRDGTDVTNQNELSSFGTFTPKQAGTYTITASYTDPSAAGQAEGESGKANNVITSTKVITVNRKTVKIVPKVNANKSITYDLPNIPEADKTAIRDAIDTSCIGLADGAKAGIYPIVVTYKGDTTIDKKYLIICDNDQKYEVKGDVVQVTNATTDSNGKVKLQYTDSKGNTYDVGENGQSLDVPKGVKLTATAMPNVGYRVEKWTEKVGDSIEGPIFSSSGMFNTSNVITKEGLQTKYSIKADFTLTYYNLTMGFATGSSGSIIARYLSDAGTEEDIFYDSNSPSLTPTTATQQLSPLKKVRITATPSQGQVISGWKIYSGTDSEGTLVKNDDGTTYTGNTYIVSSINANTWIKVETAEKTERTIKVTLVGQDDAKLGSQASVSFNAKEATSVDGTYTYTTAQHDNVVINLTIPDSLIVDSWKIGETEQNVGTLSNNKKTLSISNLQLSAESMDLTVHCKAPNSYGVTVEQKIGDATVTDEDALPATITIKKNGTNAEVGTTNPSVPEATILRVIIQEKEGYELKSVSCNGREQTTQDTQGGKAFTIDGVHADVNIVATFVKLKEYTVTFSVVDTNGDEPGGTNGTLTATAERKGKTYDGFGNGSTVYEGATVTFTAEPANKGYRVKEWRVGTEVYRPDGSTTDFIEERLTLDAVKAAKGVTVQFTPIGNKVIIQAEGQGTITSARVGLTEQLGNISEGFVLQGGSAVTITAAPSQGYEVMHWIVNGKIVPGTENQNRYTYSAETNSSGALIKAVFQPVNYTVRWSGENGTVTKTDGETTKEAQVRGGTSIIFHAAPDNGYVLSGWTVNGETVENATNPDFTWSVPLGVPAEQEYTVKAIFQRNATPLTVTYQVEGNVGGTIATANGQDGSVSVVYGGDVTFTAEPDEYYSVKEWKVGSNTVPNSDNKSEYTLQNVTEDTMVTVVFQKALSFTVGYEAGQNGTIQAKENGQSLQLETEHTKDIPGGSTLEFKAVPATGSPNYMVAKWTVNNVEVTKDNMSKLGVTMEQGHPLSNTLTIESLDKAVTVKVKFKTYHGYTIPQNQTGYVIETPATRVPDDTQPTTQIRDNGDLTFTVKPNGTKHYMTIGTLIVNGYDCIANKVTDANKYAAKCDSVSATKNENGSYTVTIINVQADIETKIVAHQVIVGSLTVPLSLANKEGFKTPQEIQTKLEAKLTGRKDGMDFYDIALKTYDSAMGKWIEVTDDNFPTNGVDVKLDYPQNTDRKDTFQIVHMLTKSGREGEIEKITPENKSDGLHFHVDSLSPFGVSWTKYVAPTPGGGGGGGGGAVSTYTLTFDTNGGSAIDKITKDSGTTIDLAAYKPTRAGYTFAGWFSDKALTKAVTSVKLTANTTVYAKWTQSGTAQNPFVDVKEGAYYYDAVLWAVEQKITSGTSATTFSPDASCTRAQMVTFLWRAAGSPKVENGKNPFADVKADAYYYDAVLWAVEKGVTSGTSATTFSPDATVTRGQTVTFLYRNAGSPEVSGTMPFADVEADAYYAKAVQWAVQQKITTGTSETTFSPMSDCTRGQIVTFLYRAK